MVSTPVDRDRFDAGIHQFLTIAALANGRASVSRDAFRFARGRVMYAPQAGVAEIQNAIVLAGEWFVLTGGFALCDAFNQTPFPPRSAYHMGVPFPNVIDLIYPEPQGRPIERGFLLGGCRNYCHWLMDYLPRIELLRDDWPILVNGDLQPLQEESLQLLGIERDRLITLGYPGAYAVEHLRFPSINSSWCVLPIPFRMEVVTWLRTKFKSVMSAGGGRRLFISRQDAKTAHGRRLQNAQEVIELVQRYDFEVVASEALSFQDQVRLFSEADIVVGAHGAGFTNLVFSPARCRAIELIGPRLAREESRCAMAYQNLAGLLDQQFVRCVGRSDEAQAVEQNHLVNETFSIDPVALAKLIEQAIG
jgi:hypothetical protein